MQNLCQTHENNSQLKGKLCVRIIADGIVCSPCNGIMYANWMGIVQVNEDIDYAEVY